jgi:hypothetical protein
MSLSYLKSLCEGRGGSKAVITHVKNELKRVEGNGVQFDWDKATVGRNLLSVLQLTVLTTVPTKKDAGTMEDLFTGELSFRSGTLRRWVNKSLLAAFSVKGTNTLRVVINIDGVMQNMQARGELS